VVKPASSVLRAFTAASKAPAAGPLVRPLTSPALAGDVAAQVHVAVDQARQDEAVAKVDKGGVPCWR
jgi:hypothetical protein